MWTPELDESGPAYLAITRALEADIGAGRLPDGTRLPTHRSLAERLGVNVGTVSRAYAEARRRGLVVGEVGRGTFVRRGLDTFGPAADDRVVDLGVNLPLSEPAPDLPAALGRLGAGSEVELHPVTHYGDPAGSPRARAAGAAWLATVGVAAEADQVLVCNGAQHGILVALGAFAGPGEAVLAESLSYPGFRAAATLLGVRVRGVAVDQEGIVPDALEAACVDRPRLLYFTPDLQNPTGSRLSAARREAVVELARRYDLWLVVDDIQGPMLDRVVSIAELAPERTITIAGVSKVLLPGLRTAFVSAPSSVRSRLAEVLWASTWAGSPLGALLAARWIEDGTAERMALLRRKEMDRRHALAHRCLPGLALDSQPGAYHAWLRLPAGASASTVSQRLLEAGVQVITADRFLVNPSAGPAPEALRLSLSAPRSHAMLRRGLDAVCRVVREGDGPPPRL